MNPGPKGSCARVRRFSLGSRLRALWRIFLLQRVLDASGKVHGYLPEVQDLRRYHAEDLARLRDQLRIRVQTRIAKTVELGADYGHDARILEEQQLLKSIEKHWRIASERRDWQ
jgi:hypothetical protein